MAKKQDLSELFRKTESDANLPADIDLEALNEGNIRSLGVGLREGEIKLVDKIAGELGVYRNALLRFAVRWFLLEYLAGRVEISDYIKTPPPQKRTLRLPGEE